MANGKLLGSQLIFISMIHRDGKSVEVITDQHDMKHYSKTEFTMNSLSITLGTWIACEFNSFVVKLK